MAKSTRVSRVAVALVVAGGAIWVVSGVLYSAQIVSCFTCRSVVVAPGVGTTGYPIAAIRSLAWDDLYATVYVVTIGLLAIIIGLTAFRRGEKWAWYAMAAFVLAGVMTSLLDYMSWGGWYTFLFLFLGLLPLLGLALSAKTILSAQPNSGKRDKSGVTLDGT
ncbi:MAG: hypothetical protein ACLQUY_11255 [Ktedonobacterales bacterium]